MVLKGLGTDMHSEEIFHVLVMQWSELVVTFAALGGQDGTF